MNDLLYGGHGSSFLRESSDSRGRSSMEKKLRVRALLLEQRFSPRICQRAAIRDGKPAVWRPWTGPILVFNHSG